LATRRPPTSTLFPYTTLFRSSGQRESASLTCGALVGKSDRTDYNCHDTTIYPLPRHARSLRSRDSATRPESVASLRILPPIRPRSEEHTSELQSRENLVCRLL